MKQVRIFLGLILLILVNACNSRKIYSSATIQQLDKTDYLQRLHSCDNCLLIDVRTAAEYKKGHLDNATNISFIFNRFGRKVKQLDTSKIVFLYCETAHRSPLATKKLKKAGFKNIYDLKNGYSTIKKSPVN